MALAAAIVTEHVAGVDLGIDLRVGHGYGDTTHPGFETDAEGTVTEVTRTTGIAVDERVLGFPDAAGERRAGVTASVGVASSGELPDEADEDALLAAADVAMYEAKRTGSDGYAVHRA